MARDARVEHATIILVNGQITIYIFEFIPIDLDYSQPWLETFLCAVGSNQC